MSVLIRNGDPPSQNMHYENTKSFRGVYTNLAALSTVR